MQITDAFETKHHTTQSLPNNTNVQMRTDVVLHNFQAFKKK